MSRAFSYCPRSYCPRCGSDLQAHGAIFAGGDVCPKCGQILGACEGKPMEREGPNMWAGLTLGEFRQWLEGFEEAFAGGQFSTGHPSKEQWAKIKAKLALIDPQPAKGPIFRGLDPAAGPDRTIIHTYAGGQIITPGSNEPKEQDQ